MVANIKAKIQVPKTAETPPSRRMPNKNVLPFFQKLAATIEKPETELEYQSNFELLIAVILSAQATDSVSIWLPANYMPLPIPRKQFWIWVKLG